MFLGISILFSIEKITIMQLNWQEKKTENFILKQSLLILNIIVPVGLKEAEN